MTPTHAGPPENRKTSTLGIFTANIFLAHVNNQSRGGPVQAPQGVAILWPTAHTRSIVFSSSLGRFNAPPRKIEKRKTRNEKHRRLLNSSRLRGGRGQAGLGQTGPQSPAGAATCGIRSTSMSGEPPIPGWSFLCRAITPVVQIKTTHRGGEHSAPRRPAHGVVC
jgi:hypothetical protein